jgi:hypothetical protein
MHHDALEFPDGKMVLLTDLWESQEATLLQLPAQPATAAEITKNRSHSSVDLQPLFRPPSRRRRPEAALVLGR